MKRKIKTAIALTLAIATVAAVFTGCANKKRTPKAPKEPIAYTSDGKEPSSTLKHTVKLNKGEYIDIDFQKEVTFDTISLYESGDNCREFNIYADNNGEWELIYKQDRIMAYHLCYTKETSTTKIRIEIADCVKSVKIKKLFVYKGEKTNESFKVSQYLRFDVENFENLIDDPGFSGYYDVVTDPIIFGPVYLNENAEVCFNGGEEKFSNQLEYLRKIIGNRNVNIWCCIFFDQNNENGERDLNTTKDFVINNIDKINTNIKAFVEKYNLYGIDYDWEYPRKNDQWKAYDLIVTETAKYTKVSVAIPPWAVKFSNDAKSSIEHVNVMAYDLFDQLGDHSNYYNAGYEVILKVRDFGFEDKQILVGIPTYARTTDKSEFAWPTVRDDGKDLGEWGKIVKDYPYTDTNTNENKACDGYLNSYAEVRDKTATAIDEGIGGVMIFRAFCDSPYTDQYSRTKAIKETLDEKSK